ncbi:MAG: putative quinol monooxygenase [Candidatus Binatia bacterium]
MILLIIKIDVRPTKQKELVQTVSALAEQVRQEAGCVSSHCYRDVDHENTLCIVEEWATQADVDVHLRTDNWKVLRGAVKLLNGPAEIRFHTVSQTRGEEATEAVRRH